MKKPRLFVGSSVEGLPVARAIKEELDYDMEVVIWSQGVFKLSHSPLEDLSEELKKADFASFVFLPEDNLEIRGEKKATVRDNVVFELGLFYGKLGRDRVSFVVPKNYDLHLPSDLTGVTGGEFEYPSSNLVSSVGTYCNKIREQMKSLKASYPMKGYYGFNILHKDIDKVKGTASFCAVAPNSELLIKIENKTNEVNFGFDVGSTGNWKVGVPPSNDHNIVNITGENICDSDMCFRIMNNGNILITIFENGNLVCSKNVLIEC